MKKIVYTMLIFCMTPFLVQCIATQKDVNSVNLRIRAIDYRVATIDREFVELKNQTVEQVQKRQAKVGDQIDNQQAEILSLKGLLEESAHQNRMLREENKEYKTNFNSRLETLAGTLDAKITNTLDTKIGRLDERTAQIETALRQVTTEIEEIKQARAREAAERAQEAVRAAEKAQARIERSQTLPEISPDQLKKKANKPAPPATKAPAPPPATTAKTPAATTTKTPAPPPATITKPAPPPAKEKEADGNPYEQAQARFKAGKYKEAHDILAAYIDKNPKGDMAANARILMGDALFGQKEFELAILEYQRVIADFPYHLKAPAAMLKQGEAFEKINDNTTAGIVYKKLLADYPKSDEVKTAKARLEALK